MNQSFEPQVIIGDCREILPTLTPGSVHLAVTSPPYNIGKAYQGYKDNKPFDEWEKLIGDIAGKTYSALTPNGSFFLNVAIQPDKRTSELYPMDSIAYSICKTAGFALRNKIIWTFSTGQNATKRLSGRWETILWFVKDIANYVFNLDAIRVPFDSAYDPRVQRRIRATGVTGRNPGDVWHYEVTNNMVKQSMGILGHPCVYPLEMIKRIVAMASNEGDVVLDMFAGSGTTLVAAAQLKRRGIGIEISETYKDLIYKRLDAEAAPGLFSPRKLSGVAIEPLFGTGH